MAAHLLALALILPILFANTQFNEPRRPIDLWNPFGVPTTRKPGIVVGFKRYFMKLMLLFRRQVKAKY